MLKRTSNTFSKRIIFLFTICVGIIICIGFLCVQIVSASTSLKDSDSFGLGTERFKVDAQVGVMANSEFEDSNSFESAQTALATYTTRDISTALSSISYKIEQDTLAAAEAAKAQELSRINIAKNRRNDHEREYGMPPELSEINWDQGRDAFIAE